MATKFSENSEGETSEFVCKECDYVCSKKQHYKQHCNTAKHKKQIINSQATENNENSSLCCENCKKQYVDRSGLWRHKKKCIITNNNNNSTPIIERLLTDNQELRNFIMEQTRLYTTNMNEIVEKNAEILSKVVETCKPINNNNNTTINNNNNQRFNINVFLNEQCKDAINFSDFVKNIQISYEDLENNAQLGFVNGISKIFMDNLKQLDVNERPIHCTDVKRETMYIKDDNTWTKQADDEKLQKAIQTVSYRSMGKLAEWKNENPEYKDCNSEFSQKCLDIQRQTLAGSDRGVYYPKVIHALARETIVEK
jgi:hypothetical protein